ncbi:hypothetical protein EV424DRAFT_1432856 [Suillus variegatus]|nr:hypothetical protein EV424DRAFT_1432856 [Suillus variegatus]
MIRIPSFIFLIPGSTSWTVIIRTPQIIHPYFPSQLLERARHLQVVNARQMSCARRIFHRVSLHGKLFGTFAITNTTMSSVGGTSFAHHQLGSSAVGQPSIHAAY